MKKRRAFITFPEKLGNTPDLFNLQKKIEGVNIKFSVETFSPVGVASDAYISIYNLNRDDMGFLTTTVNSWIAKRNLIQLYAGYDDDVSLLYSGQIINAPPSGNPDVSVDVRGLSSVDWMGQTVSLKKDDLKVIDLLDYAGTITKSTVNMPAWLRNTNELLNRRIEHFSYTGTPMGLLNKISDMLGGFRFTPDAVNLSIQDNEQINVWSPQIKGNEQILLVSEDTGMIGYPSPYAGGIEVTVLLNPSIKAGDIIRVKSKRIPLCNGDYFVVSVKHQGELRGNMWQTTLKCSYTSSTQQQVVENVRSQQTTDNI